MYRDQSNPCTTAARIGDDSISIHGKLKDGHRGRLSKVPSKYREPNVLEQTGHDGRFAACSWTAKVRKTVSADKGKRFLSLRGLNHPVTIFDIPEFFPQ
jgi:hypothetical protein